MDASRYWGWSAPSGGGLLARNWGWFMLRGLVALIMGTMAILRPVHEFWAFTLLFAAFASFDGFFSAVAGLRGARAADECSWPMILRGGIGILIGLLFSLMPAVAVLRQAVEALALLALWSIATGTFEIAGAVRLRRDVRGEWLMIFSGILSVLLGIAIPMVLIFDPIDAIPSFAVMIGAYSLLAGFVLIALGFKLRQRRRLHLSL
jgi:uncharacterized membrane protein HdeD (DUF308 family)